MLSIRMNDEAVRSLGLSAGASSAVLPGELTPELRALIDAGVVRRDDVLVFAKDAGKVDRAPSWFPDLTGWECSVSSFHLDDVVPVDVAILDDGEPLISEADQVLMLRHGLAFAMEIVRLVNALKEPVPVRCIVGANSSNGTFRFHRARPGESWLAADVDSYTFFREKLIVVDSGPFSLGGKPW